MNVQPLRSKMLVRLDPEPERARGLFIPDLDSIRVCRKCERRQEALDGPCPKPDDDYSWDKYNDRPVFRGQSYSHDIQVVQAPIIPLGAKPARSSATTATVVKVGAAIRDFAPGDRVVVGYVAGRGTHNLRLIPESAVLARVEE